MTSAGTRIGPNGHTTCGVPHWLDGVQSYRPARKLEPSRLRDDRDAESGERCGQRAAKCLEQPDPARQRPPGRPFVAQDARLLLLERRCPGTTSKPAESPPDFRTFGERPTGRIDSTVKFE